MKLNEMKKKIQAMVKEIANLKQMQSHKARTLFCYDIKR